MNKKHRSSEDFVSMFFGLVIVVAIVGLIFYSFQKKRGTVNVPGVTDDQQLSLIGKSNLYKVKKGDSLWKIAQEKLGSGYEWTKIAKENNIKNVGVIEIGQELKLPNTAVTNTNLTINNNTYKVVKGDCLWKIAVAKYADGYQWVKIWKENKKSLKDPSKLEIGMVLNLP